MVSDRPERECRVLRVGERRTAGLTVERDGTITAAVPPGTGDATLARLISAKRQWLYAKLRERAELGGPRSREYVSGEGFPYLGRPYRLLLVDEAPVPVRLNLTSRRLELRRDSVHAAARHLARWYRQQGTEWLVPRAADGREDDRPPGPDARLPVGVLLGQRDGQHPLGRHAGHA